MKRYKINDLSSCEIAALCCRDSENIYQFTLAMTEACKAASEALYVSAAGLIDELENNPPKREAFDDFCSEVNCSLATLNDTVRVFKAVNEGARRAGFE